MQRTRRFRFVAVLIGVGIALVLGEFLIWLASPTEYMSPRYQFSAAYGLIPFPDVVMVHGVPRKYEYHYTINHQQCRGALADANSTLPAVVTLGDSYAFGMGVEDGAEFPAVMARELAGRWQVVNLASPGWGLTQQIRRFYELGVTYHPSVVVLQYCANDPDDNLANRVTMVENGNFVFIDSENPLNWVKKYLSKSPVQRTQLYNFFRTRASRALLPRQVAHEASQLQTSDTKSGPPPQERVYVELLDAFARRLKSEGRTFYVISVDRQLEEVPHIRQEIMDLESQGLLDYVEVLDWLEGHGPYRSPEGHIWGARAHEIVGEGLAHLVAQSPVDSVAVQ